MELSITHHPWYPVYNADCYYYQVTLLCWDKTDKPATHSRQLGDWIMLTDKLPFFKFSFSKPLNMTHWLLCVRVILGVKKSRVEAFVGEGMQIFDVGSFDKKEFKVIKEREDAALHEVKISMVMEAEEVRVKAKKV